MSIQGHNTLTRPEVPHQAPAVKPTEKERQQAIFTQFTVDMLWFSFTHCAIWFFFVLYSLLYITTCQNKRKTPRTKGKIEPQQIDLQ